MPLRLLTLYKGYRNVSNSLSSIRKSTDAPESWGDAMLYDPPANSRQVAPAAPSSPCPSTVCLPGTPRHGPLIDFDDGCNDEPEEETNKIVHEVRGELMSDEFDETAEEIDKCGEENAAGREDDAPGGIAADGRFSPRTTLACTHVCNKDNKQVELFEFFGVDEDAVELKGELRLDEQEGIVLETIFDCNSEGGGYESNDSSNGLDDSWCTTDEIAATPTEEEPPEDAVVKKNSVYDWLGRSKKTQPTQRKAKNVAAIAFDTELRGLVDKEADVWADVEQEVSGKTRDAVCSSTESSCQHFDFEVLGDVDTKELDSIFAQMETAEEGKSTEVGPLQRMRHYGDDTSGSVDYVVVDRPSLDFLDRLGALEGANLREG